MIWLYEKLFGCWHRFQIRKRWKGCLDEVYQVCLKCGKLK